jgi:hypothetical protein
MGFILDRVKEGKQDEARALLEESFAKQSDGSFDAAYIIGFAPRIAGTLKPEFVDEVKKVMTDFGKNFTDDNPKNVISSLTSGGYYSSLFDKGKL